jgi:hypothetical protein
MSSFCSQLDAAFNKAGDKLSDAVGSLNESVNELIDNKDKIAA